MLTAIRLIRAVWPSAWTASRLQCSTPMAPTWPSGRPACARFSNSEIENFLSRVAGVDRQHSAGHVAAALTHEEFHHARNVIGFGETAQRTAACNLFTVFIAQALGE